MSQKFPTRPHRSFSELQTARKNSKSELPLVLQDPRAVLIEENEALGAAADHAEIEKAFPHTYGIALILSIPQIRISNYGRCVLFQRNPHMIYVLRNLSFNYR